MTFVMGWCQVDNLPYTIVDTGGTQSHYCSKRCTKRAYQQRYQATRNPTGTCFVDHRPGAIGVQGKVWLCHTHWNAIKSSCYRKIRHSKKRKADAMVLRMNNRHGVTPESYFCYLCGEWHVGNKPTKNRGRGQHERRRTEAALALRRNLSAEELEKLLDEWKHVPRTTEETQES